MRLLIDECLPRALKRLLPEHTCCTVQEMAWAGIKNGALLSLAEAEFDALITIDQGFAYQQDLKERRIAILLLRVVPTTRHLHESRLVRRTGEIQVDYNARTTQNSRSVLPVAVSPLLSRAEVAQW